MKLTSSLPQKATLLKLESSLIFPVFTSDTAYVLGTRLRSRIRSLDYAGALISISLASGQPLYLSTSGPYTLPDNSVWIARKTATVLRFGISSYAMGRELDGDEQKFQKKYMLGEKAGEFAIHGGAVPVRVQGMGKFVVATVSVSGLAQAQDHMVVVEEMQRAIAEMHATGEDLREHV